MDTNNINKTKADATGPQKVRQEAMDKVVSLCKRRGFVFQSGEIYGGLRSFYDYGPLGYALKQNISKLWWHHMVEMRENVVGMDASIIMHPRVWKASGHLEGFTDPLVDCKNCKERFRPDKQPRLAPGTMVKWEKIEWGPQGSKGRREKHTIVMHTAVGEEGYVCPVCSCPHLSEERTFHGMFRSFLGAIDVLAQCTDNTLKAQELRKLLEKHSVYLRPETAQAMFTQYLNIQQSMGLKIPFGIAQQGRSFRNEIVVEHFIFRSCEFEQMEMEFFCEPGTEDHWLDYWCQQRLAWYECYAQNAQSFRLREHEAQERAHYSRACFDIEYDYPWGWDELEGVACRGDYDLRKHAQASRVKLMYLDQTKQDPKTQKIPWRYYPTVIEPAAGLTRAVLCFLLDAYCEEHGESAGGKKTVRTVLKLHPCLAPYKVAVLPLVNKEFYVKMSQEIASSWRQKGIALKLDDKHSIGKRYARHDEIGTPFALTVDAISLEDGSVTLRDRDSGEQQRMTVQEAQQRIADACTPAFWEFAHGHG